MHVAAGIHEPVLGTRLDLRITADDEPAAQAAERAVLAELDRLEALVSAYRPGSEWSRWRRSELDVPGPEVRALLVLADEWWRRSGGAFHPGAGVLLARWRRAEQEQVLPDDSELATLAGSSIDLPYRVDGTTVSRTGDCSTLDLHSLAKGWIVDRAAEAAMALSGVRAVVVNAGGDLLHRGKGGVSVGVEDPRRPFDNVAPAARVRLCGAGLATSSGARRPIRIAGVAHTHVLDPRTGRPVDAVLSATALAPDAATADVLATVLTVLPPADGMAFVATVPGAAGLVLDRDGTWWRSAGWPDDVSR